MQKLTLDVGRGVAYTDMARGSLETIVVWKSSGECLCYPLGV